MSSPKPKQPKTGPSNVKRAKGLVQHKWYKLDKNYRRSIIYTSLLHLAVVLALMVGWQSTPEVKPIAMPKHINATVIDASTIEVLNKKKQDQEKKKKTAVDAKKKAADKKKRDAKKRQEDKKKKEAKRKKAEERKKADAKKKTLVKKKAEEKKKADAKKKALLKKKKDEQKKRDDKKRIEEKKRVDEKKRIEEKKRNDELKRKEQERQLQDMMLKAENEAKLALEAQRLKQQQIEQQNIEQENIRQAQLTADRIAEVNEVDRFIALIRAKITRSWHKPQGAKNGQTVVLRLNLFPTGELGSVVVINGSGDLTFDRSALSAAKSVSKYPVPSDNKIFEKHFRQFSMSFSHQED